jgi:hypothetical protein
MWYGSNLAWGKHPEHMAHVIKYAESDNLIDWRPTGRVAIGLADPSEYAIACPRVIDDGDRLRMWYSHRGAHYRIGYAESRDGLSWQRRDAEAGIEMSAAGWDAISVQYACVFDHGSERYMFYNGSGYGATGFGLAVLER